MMRTRVSDKTQNWEMFDGFFFLSFWTSFDEDDGGGKGSFLEFQNLLAYSLPGTCQLVDYLLDRTWIMCVTMINMHIQGERE